MLQIDRVETEVELLRREDAGRTGAGAPSGGLVPGRPALDPVRKEQLRDVVMEILRDHLRQLERRGVL